MPEFEASAKIVKELTTHFAAFSAAARGSGQRWTATATAMRLIAAAQRRVLYENRERALQARVLALYDRFM